MTESPQRVAICVCTCLRPKMLTRCLDSLLKLKIPANIYPYIVIIDNDPEGGAAHGLAPYFGNSRLTLHYIHQPHRGIAHARNAALDAAARIGADWLAVIDDDETADKNWLLHLMAAEYQHIPVPMGWQEIVWPAEKPFWWVPPNSAQPPEGQVLRTAYTNNVRFSYGLVAAGLRFDEGLGLGGGEDSEYFMRAYLKRFQIRRTLRAITYESAHMTRLTFRRIFGLACWLAASNTNKFIAQRGVGWLLTRKAHTIPLNFVLGALFLALSPVVLIGGLTAFKRCTLAGADKIARSCGRIAALANIPLHPYAVIDGE